MGLEAVWLLILGFSGIPRPLLGLYCGFQNEKSLLRNATQEAHFFAVQKFGAAIIPDSDALFHFNKVAAVGCCAVCPFNLVRVASSSECKNAVFYQCQARDAVADRAVVAVVACPVDFVFQHVGAQIFVDRCCGQSFWVDTCYEVCAYIFATFCEDGDAESFVAASQATSQVVNHCGVFFSFESRNGLWVYRHAAESCAALEFWKELVEFPLHARCFCSRAGFELCLQFCCVESIRQFCFRELCDEVLERRLGLLCIQGEEACECKEKSRD